jgi:hypothetical protein
MNGIVLRSGKPVVSMTRRPIQQRIASRRPESSRTNVVVDVHLKMAFKLIRKVPLALP